jgi:hypothetical protein
MPNHTSEPKAKSKASKKPFNVNNRIKKYIMIQHGLRSNYQMGPKATAFINGALEAHIVMKTKSTSERIRKEGHSQMNCELISGN